MSRTKYPPLTQSIYSCAQLARHFKIDYNVIREACTTGQIPWVVKRGHMWIVSRRGGQFLGEWLSRHGDLHAIRYPMREAAAALDPSVIERQPEPTEPAVERLTKEQVKDIRQRRRKGESLDSIGADYEREKSAISLIARGLRYA
jgi:hypothetical protein